MKKVSLRIPGGRSYPIWIGNGLFLRARDWMRESGQAFLIADRELKSHTLTVDRALRAAGWKTQIIPLDANEGAKSLSALDQIYRQLIEGGADRNSVLFAVGGGVMGDITGFVAATYMRGIRWVGVPTTLLAQVDSSVGGKTGVNHALGKNLIGTFHQPVSVVCDVSFLKTLPRREVVSGLGEVVKYGLLSKPSFFEWITENRSALLDLDTETVIEAVTRCVTIKARIVEKDERETLGKRASLNLGHTIGHALETATKYSCFRHGEAVLVGLRSMLELSVERGHLAPGEKAEILQFLSRIPVPVIPRSVSARKIANLTLRDKKAVHGKRRFVLLKKIGAPVLDATVTEQELLRSLRASGFGA